MFIGSEFATLQTILSPPCFVKGILTIPVQRINTAEWSDVAGKKSSVINGKSGNNLVKQKTVYMVLSPLSLYFQSMSSEEQMWGYLKII